MGIFMSVIVSSVIMISFAGAIFALKEIAALEKRVKDLEDRR